MQCWFVSLFEYTLREEMRPSGPRGKPEFTKLKIGATNKQEE